MCWRRSWACATAETRLAVIGAAARAHLLRAMASEFRAHFRADLGGHCPEWRIGGTAIHRSLGMTRATVGFLGIGPPLRGLVCRDSAEAIARNRCSTRSAIMVRAHGTLFTTFHPLR